MRYVVRVYATVDDLEDEVLGTPDPDRLLALASTVVDLLLAGCLYDVDTDGLPTDTGDADLLKRLTVLQAVYMAEDPDGHRDTFRVLRTSTVTAERSGSRPRFAPRAVELLQAEGLPGQGVVVRR